MIRAWRFSDTEFLAGITLSLSFAMRRFSAETEIGIRAASFTAAYPKH
jgi:hypothetical protein